MARADRGELHPGLTGVTRPKTSGNLAGMRGYTVGYDDAVTGARVFLVHFFMDDEGNLAASGLADPKWLYEEGRLYVPLVTAPSQSA